MHMSIAEVHPDRQVKHPPLRYPMECSKILYFKLRKRVKEHRAKQEIRKDLQQENSWL